MRNGCTGCLIVIVILGAVVFVPTVLFMVKLHLLAFLACVIIGCLLFRRVNRLIFGKKKKEDEDVSEG